MASCTVAGLKRLSFCLSTQPSALDCQFCFSELTNRELLIVRGSDTRKFLQGVITNDVELLYSSNQDSIAESRTALYTLFLNPKGKIVNDGIIIRPIMYHSDGKQFVDNQLWVDIDKRCKDGLLTHLQRYTWKKDVQILSLQGEEQEDMPHLHAGFTSSLEIQTGSDSETQKLEKLAGKLIEIPSVSGEVPMQDGLYANIGFHDPRLPQLGVRMICSGQGFDFQASKSVLPVSSYEEHCRLHGLTSSPLMVNKLPFMFNADLFNGFSFNKGCYLGQELVARAYHTGIVRRRIFPFIINSETAHNIKPDCILKDENGGQLGKVIEVTNRAGSLLMNYIPRMSQDSWPIQIASPEPGLIFNPYQTKVRQYLKQMQTKQQKLNLIDI